MTTNVFVLVLVLLVSAAESAKILGVFMIPSYSHQRVFQPIWRELSLRGHEVTIYTPNPLNDTTLTNLTEIDLSLYCGVADRYMMNVLWGSKLEEVKNLFLGLSTIYRAQMSSPEMRELVANKKKEKYDLFLVEYVYPSMYPFKDVFDCPMVGITSLSLTAGGLEAMGMIKHPVLDPDLFLPFATDLSFRERVTSTVFYLLTKLFFAFIRVPILNAEAREFFGENTRDVLSLTKEASVVLGYFNYITQNVRPNVPAFVELPGIHLEPEKPLPQDLKQFLDKSKEGVIYFSLGSNVKVSELPSLILNKFLSAFSELPYDVLLKFEDEDRSNISSILKNAKAVKWVPQQDVLRHPNVRLFITQGGLQSIDESLYNKVPMLIVPFFGDQHFNSHKMVSSGAALSIDFNDFTKDEVLEKANRLIKDPQYKKTVSELGSKAFDYQVPALEKAIWWIEYVIRHKGADHLKYKAADMPFYQFFLLDVFITLAVSITITSYILFRLGKMLISGLGSVKTLRTSIDLKKSQ